MTRLASMLVVPALLLVASPAAAQTMGELGAAMSTNSALHSTSAPGAAKTLQGVVTGWNPAA